jgi:hypothetical protein
VQRFDGGQCGLVVSLVEGGQKLLGSI